jgi:class 3 adenylate cyclase
MDLDKQVTKYAQSVARYFYHHILAELEKKTELIDSIQFDNKTPREIDEYIRGELIQYFPGIEQSEPPEYNLFVEWAKLNEFGIAYRDFSFEAYNLIFLERLMYLQNYTAEAKVEFHEKTIEIFRKFPSVEKGFSISFYLRSENNMRELLRKMILEDDSLDYEQIWEIVFQQSKDYQEVVNNFFEQLLIEANERTESLLHNILPVEIADELKEYGSAKPKAIDEASVLFTDFEGFTKLCSKMNPEDLLSELDECFSLFDQIADKFNLEKIKTIGDSYMVASGVPNQSNTHLIDLALAALEIQQQFEELYRTKTEGGKDYWRIRIGLHTGPLVAGIIGKKKFSYDIWGDTVNTASRMEHYGEAGIVNCSPEAYEQLKYVFRFKARGTAEVKGKGIVSMYALLGLKEKYWDKAHYGKLYSSIQKLGLGKLIEKNSK